MNRTMLLWVLAAALGGVWVGSMGSRLWGRDDIEKGIDVHPSPVIPKEIIETEAVAPLQLSESDVWVVRPLTLTHSLRVSGTLKAVDTAFIKAKVSAEVASLTVREGDVVHAGQLIGQLDTTELNLKLRQAEQAAATSRAQAEIARRTLENNRALVKEGFISATGLETSASNDAAAQATYEAALAAVALARKNRDDAQLRSPMNGQISQRMVQVGERVSLDSKLLEVVDLRRIELEATLPPDDIELVRVGQKASLRVDGVASPLNARVVRISPSTQTGTRAVLVYLALESKPSGPIPSGVRHGQFAQGTIHLEQQTALAIPINLIQWEPGSTDRGHVLALVRGKVERVIVRLGGRGQVNAEGSLLSAVAIRQGLGEGAVLLRPSVGPLAPGTAAVWADMPSRAAEVEAAGAASTDLPQGSSSR